MSEWFNGTPKIEEKRLVPYQARWLCPKDDCQGEMKFNGFTWPTGTPGYHHTCTACQYTAAMRGKKYPAIEYKEDGGLDGA